jgi:serine/threonine protein kinase
VVIDHEGHLMLTDFGIAKSGVSDTDSTSNMTFCGSPMYLAPEMLQRKGHGQSLDWYSMGALLFEMLSGLPPFYSQVQSTIVPYTSALTLHCSFYSQDRSTLFQNILKAELRMPDSASAHAQDLMAKLLDRAPETRLGSGSSGAADIKAHSFFGARSTADGAIDARERAATSSGLEEAIDWGALYRKEIAPPHCPCTPSTRPDGMPDLTNFSRTFREQAISDEEKGLSSKRASSRSSRVNSAAMDKQLFW